MTGGPQFTVVIPTIGRPDDLNRAVQSVLHQTLQDFEVIVVADGVAVPDLPRDPRIRALALPLTRGPAAARNAGIEAALGENLAFLDDDDEYLPDRLAIAARGLEALPIAVCEPLGVSLRRRRERGRPSTTRWLERDIGTGRVPVGVGCVAVTRATLPMFNENYLACEDWDWWLRLATRAPAALEFRAGWKHGGHEGPRVLHGVDARIAFSWRLLEDHATFFDCYPAAMAYRLRRIGLLELDRNEPTAAAAAFRASLRARPNARAAYHYLRTVRRGRER
jgi:glycosyltransferase involved in cell wall biosynthesis